MANETIFEIAFDAKGFSQGDAKNLLELLSKSNAEAEGLKSSLESITLSKPLSDASKFKDAMYQLSKASGEALDMSAFEEAIKDFGSQIPKIKAYINEVKATFKDIKDPKELKALKASVKLVEDSLKDLDGQSQKTVSTQKELTKEVKKTDDAFKPLRKQIRENTIALQEMENQGKQNTKEYKNLQKATSELIDQQGDLQSALKKGASDTRKLDLGVEGVNTAVAAYQTYLGVIGLVGGENEELQKSLQKLMAVQQVAQGIQQIGIFFTEKGGAATALATKAQELYAIATGKSTIAMNGFKLALAATGIGAAIVAIGLLAANWDKVSNAIGIASKAQNTLNDAMEKAKGETTELQENIFKVGIGFEQAKKGVISKEEALKTYNDTLGKTYGTFTDYNSAEAFFIEATPLMVEAALARATAEQLIKKAAEENINLLIEQKKGASDLEKVLSSVGFASIIGANRLGKEKEAKESIELDKKLAEDQIKLSQSLNDRLKALREKFGGVLLNKTKEHGKKEKEQHKKTNDDKTEEEKRYFIESEKVQDEGYIKAIDKAKDYYSNISKAEQDFRDKLNENKIANIQDSTQKELAELENSHQIQKRATENAVKDNEENLLNFISLNPDKREEALKRIEDFNEIARQIQIENDIKYQDDKLKIAQKSLSDTFNAIQSNIALIESERERDLANEALLLGRKYSEGKIKKEEYEKSLADLEKKYDKIKLEDKKKGFDDQIKSLEDQLNLETDTSKAGAIEKQINDLKAARDKAIKDNLEDPKKGPNILDKILGLDPNSKGYEEKKTKIVEGFKSLVNSTIAILKEQTRAEIEAYDLAIGLQKKRVDDATKLAENGNTEYLKIEEERLAQLEQKREEAARRQLEIDTAVQASQILVAIAGAVAQIAQGGAVGVITGIATIGAAVASGFALLNQLNAARPKFATGVEDLDARMGVDRVPLGRNPKGTDTIPALLNEHERVVDAETNKKLLKLGVKNKDLPTLVEQGLHFNNLMNNIPKLVFNSPVVPRGALNNNNSELISKFERMEKAQKETTRAIRNINIRMGINPEGIYGIVKGIERERIKIDVA